MNILESKYKNVRLKEVLDISDSGTWGERDDNGQPVLRSSDIYENKLYYNNPALIRIPEKDKVRKELLDGDILITKSSGSPELIGKCGIFFSPELNKKYYFSNFMLRLRPNKNKVYYKWLYYWLTSSYGKHVLKRINNTTSGLRNLNITLYLNQKIPLPPLEEQKRIAAILDKADALRQKRRESIRLLDEFLRSVFLDMFGDPVTNPKGWEEVKLGALCGVGSSKRVFVNELVDSGVPFYRGTEVGKLGEELPICPSLFITEKHYEELKAQTGVPQKGDLLMPSICPDGRIYRVVDNSPFYFKDGRVLWIKVDQTKISSLYLKYFLKQMFLANYENIASGTTFAELKIVALKNLQVLLPPVDLQNVYEKSVLNVKELQAKVRASLNQMDNLFNSLVQRAFRGEL